MSGWTLVDGDYALQRPSTNGTWLYLSENFEIYSGMVFRANQTLFQVSSSAGRLSVIGSINQSFSHFFTVHILLSSTTFEVLETPHSTLFPTIAPPCRCLLEN
mmetsp:Transcript_16829/g.30152  ORF Transcript_16829/g.30152 Transcript_16829/m.30152 type:complete len:103 (+) Transcript_16829:746-1054(+)